MKLSDEFITKAVEQWVREQSRPDEPVSITQELSMTPNSVLKHIKDKTPVGQQLLESWRAILSRKKY